MSATADDVLARPADTVDPPPVAPVAPPRARLVTGTFALAWLVNFLQFLVFYVLITTLALYAEREFAASDTAGGLAASGFIIGATVARLVAGRLVDTFGRRRVLLVALALGVLASLRYLPAGSLPLLVAVRLVHGFGFAFATTATLTIAQSAIPSSRRAEGTGYLALSTTLATAVGPALGLLVVGRAGYDALFLTAAGSALLALVLGIVLRDPHAAAPARRTRFAARDLAHPAVVPIGLFMVLVGLSYAGVITYLNAYAEQRDVAAGAGLFFVAYAVAMLTSRVVLGRLQDRRGDNLVMRIGLVFFVVALVVLAVARDDWQVVVAGALTGLGYGTIMPAAQAIAVGVVPPHELGAGISTLLLFTDLGVGLGPVALGLLVSATGFGTMYAVLAGVVVLAAGVYHLVHGRHPAARTARAAA